jgi:hypothetical protein
MPPFKCAVPQDAAAKHNRVHVVANDADHSMQQHGCVLIVGVQHHHNITAQFERFFVTTFLVTTIALIVLMPWLMMCLMPSSFGFGHGFILTGIINQHYLIHNIEGNFIVGNFQRFRRIVSGQHHNYFFVVEHAMKRFKVGKDICSGTKYRSMKYG